MSHSAIFFHRRARRFGQEGAEEEGEEPIVDNPVTAWNEEQVNRCLLGAFSCVLDGV